MDISSMLGAVLSEDSVASLGKAAGVSSEEVQQVLQAALPSLLNGAVAQAEDGSTVDGFANALSQHGAGDTSDLAAFLKNVDLQDGSKIVGHLLGASSDAAIQDISERAGVSAAGTGSVMAAAAPLLMSLLGKETQQQQQQQQSLSNAALAGIMGALIKNVDLSAVLSSLLGATGSTAAPAEPAPVQESSGGGLLGALGGLFKK